MRKALIAAVVMALASASFAGGPTYLKAVDRLNVFVGDSVNVKFEFWLGDSFLSVGKIARQPNGGLELTLLDGGDEYTYVFSAGAASPALFAVEKRVGYFDGLYRLSGWGDNWIELRIDPKASLPEDFDFRPTEAEKAKYTVD